MSLTEIPGEPKPPSVLSKLLPFTTVAMIGAMAYAGWTFYSRHEENERIQQAAIDKEQAARKRVVDQVFGSGEIRFNHFSASDHLLKRGQTAQLCYGVENAKTVKIDPPVEPLSKPSYRHCIEIAPQKTTVYTITATDNAGHTESRSLEVRVQ